MSEENLKIGILEKQILKCLMEHNELLNKYEIEFISPQAQELYVDLLKLEKENKKIIPENILTLDNDFLTSDLLIAVQDTEYAVEEFDDYVEKLNVKGMIHEFKFDVLNDLNENTSDYEKLEQIKNRISELENKTNNKNNNVDGFPSLLKEYKEEIKKRASGNKNTTGDYNLDKLIGGYQAGIGLIVGMSGSMKSTFIIKLLRNRITKRLPTCAINTELTHATYMDTMLSTMIDEDYNNLTGFDSNEDDFQDWDSILQKLDELERVYERQDEKRKLFSFYPSNSVSISEINQFCKKCRKEFRLKDDEILFCTIDLLLMVKDMNVGGTSRADAITQALNKLNEIALQENIFFLGTVQARRLQNDIKIETIDDLGKYRVGLSLLKESGSLEERSRVVLSLHNPKYLANRNPTCSQMIRDLVDPILELTVLKNSWQDNLGETIYYYIDDAHKDLIDYEPNDGEVPNSGNFEIKDDEIES